ncbi:MAG: hypothetical protein ACE5GW_08225 [Planctomycetota bacterium]
MRGWIPRASAAGALALLLVAGGPSVGGGLASAQDGPARELRRAWTLHRLHCRVAEAEKIYRDLVGAEEAPADVRARAAIGLGLLERERGGGGAASWFRRALQFEEASPRWRGGARALLGEIEAERERRDGSALLMELRGAVDHLEADLERVHRKVTEKEEELRHNRKLLQRREELAEEALAARAAAPAVVDVKRSRATRWLETLIEEERSLARVRRYLVARGLQKGLEEYQQGRFESALNAMKKVLQIDPQNREALELSARCRRLFATVMGRRSLSPPEPSKTPAIDFKLAHQLVVAGMRAYLEEGRRLYRKGELTAAITPFQKVLEEYAWCPTPLDDGEIATIVRPAERLLERCFEESGIGGRGLELSGRESELLERLRQHAERLLDAEVALEDVDSSLERIRKADPEESLGYAMREVERLMRKGLHAVERRNQREALIAFRDVLTLLKWFPEIDPELTLSQDVERRLEALEGGDPPAPVVRPETPGD